MNKKRFKELEKDFHLALAEEINKLQQNYPWVKNIRGNYKKNSGFNSFEYTWWGIKVYKSVCFCFHVIEINGITLPSSIVIDFKGHSGNDFSSSRWEVFFMNSKIKKEEMETFHKSISLVVISHRDYFYQNKKYNCLFWLEPVYKLFDRNPFSNSAKINIP